MFNVYLANINFAFACFPLLALLMSVPYMAYQYRRYGSIPPWKTLCVFAFALYLLCAYYLVILPLPADRHAVVPYAQVPQMDPLLVLRELRDAAANAGLSSGTKHAWLAFLTNRNVYQAVFNVALTVPFGMFLQYFMRRPLWQTLILGFGLTLFFELTQLSGLYGLYDHPYRLFDVCDLELNTLGAVVGWLLMVPLGLLLPDVDEMNARARAKGQRYTTFTRRLVSFILDMTVVTVIYLGAYQVIGPDPVNSSTMPENFDLLLSLAVTGLVFMVVPQLLGMRTPGQLVVGLRLVTPEGSRAPWYGPIVHYGLFVWLLQIIIPWVVSLYPGSVDGLTFDDLAGVVGAAYLLWLVSIALRALMSLFHRPFVLLSELFANTRVMSSKQAQDIRMRRNAAATAAPVATPTVSTNAYPKAASVPVEAARAPQAAEPYANANASQYDRGSSKYHARR
ncbi:MAG: VanZ family protein [Coriobacteriia bacterium]|nr:VanZ family protein [Coriobacteriia bacterium]